MILKSHFQPNRIIRTVFLVRTYIFISIVRKQPFPVYRRWLEEPYHRPLNNRIGRMGPHYGYTYRTTGTVNRGHVVMISANHDSNQENGNRSMIPIDFE